MSRSITERLRAWLTERSSVGLPHRHPELGRVADGAQHLGGLQQLLGRDAAAVQARATDPRRLLDHRDVQTGRRAVERGRVATRASAQDHQVEFLGRRTHLTIGRVLPLSRTGGPGGDRPDPARSRCPSAGEDDLQGEGDEDRDAGRPARGSTGCAVCTAPSSRPGADPDDPDRRPADRSLASIVTATPSVTLAAPAREGSWPGAAGPATPTRTPRVAERAQRLIEAARRPVPGGDLRRSGRVCSSPGSPPTGSRSCRTGRSPKPSTPRSTGCGSSCSWSPPACTSRSSRR